MPLCVCVLNECQFHPENRLNSAHDSQIEIRLQIGCTDSTASFSALCCRMGEALLSMLATIDSRIKQSQSSMPNQGGSFARVVAIDRHRGSVFTKEYCSTVVEQQFCRTCDVARFVGHGRACVAAAVSRTCTSILNFVTVQPLARAWWAFYIYIYIFKRQTLALVQVYTVR